MNIILAIALKNLRITLRNLRSGWIVFILPIVFIGVFAFLFGEGKNSLVYITHIDESSIETQEQREYVEFLDTVQTGNGDKRFEITYVDSKDDSIRLVEQRKIDTLLVLSGSKVELFVDSASIVGSAATGMISNITNQYYGMEEANSVIVNDVTLREIRFTGFDYVVPGLLIYGIANFMMQFVNGLTAETQNKYTFRYFTSKVNGYHVITGYVLSQSVLALIQTGILFGAAVLFGYNANGNILTALSVALPINFFVMGLGFIIGSLFKNGDLANNVANLLVILLGFLSEAFVQFPEVVLFNSITLSELIPTWHASEAIRQILQYDRSFVDVQHHIYIILATALITFFIGAVTYNKVQLKGVQSV